MKNNYYAVIMAGGGGTRLWPLSRKSNPKQMLSFEGSDSLFKTAIDRLTGIFEFARIKIVTVEEQMDSLKKDFPELTTDQFILEPFPRGTAPVVGLAAIHLYNQNPQAVMAILTADHVIGNLEEFHQLLKTGFRLAKDGKLVTLGIRPESPSSGYGYLKTGAPLEMEDCFFVSKFVEKPDAETAEKYLEEGGYFWNSGMFIWRADRILEEISTHMPNLRHSLMKIEGIIQKPDYPRKLIPLWKEITPQTIDYGIMENAKEVVMLKSSNLGWNDVGSWDSMPEILPCDEESNVIKADNCILPGCQHMVVFEKNNKKIITAIDLDNLVIIDTEDALLVCKKGETQKVRQIIEEIKQRNLSKFL